MKKAATELLIPYDLLADSILEAQDSLGTDLGLGEVDPTDGILAQTYLNHLGGALRDEIEVTGGFPATKTPHQLLGGAVVDVYGGVAELGPHHEQGMQIVTEHLTAALASQ